MSKHVSLVCYIGNGVVKGAVVINEKNKNPTIVTTRVREFSYQEFVDREHLEFRIMSEFTTLIKDIKFKDLVSLQCAKFKVHDVCVILSSPWYVSETRIVKIAQEKPFIVTEKLLNDAIASTATDYIQKQKEGISILERNVIRYLLNGYPTHSPLKKEVKHVEVSVFLSFCKTKALQDIKQVILSHLSIQDVAVHSQSLAAFAAVRETWKDLKNYVLADISSQLTELMIVRDHTLAEASSFPLGKQYVVKELGKKLSISGEISQSLLSMYKEKTLNEQLRLKVDAALISIRQEWLRPFTSALGEMSAGTSLPSRFILFAPKDAEWLFSDFIKNEEYQQFTFSEGKFEVYEAKVQDFEHSYAIRENVQRDISLAVGTIFLHKKKEGVI